VKKFVCIFLLILTTVVALAVPARRGVTKTLKLTDGTMVTAQLVGDEHSHYTDPIPITDDSQNGGNGC